MTLTNPVRLAMAVIATAVWASASAALSPLADHGRPPVRGSVSGRVIVSTTASPSPSSLSPYARRRYQPPQQPGVPGGAEDAVVYLEPLSGSVPDVSQDPAVILQRERTIIPHVSVAQVGQLVEFPNEDDIYHNLLSLSPGNRFSLGRYAPGVTETNTFENPGVVRLFCDIHAEMAGVILVVRTPYVTRVNTDGSYSLTVPDGTYRAIAWHPTAGADTATLTIPAAPDVAQDFALLGGR